jgi:hypothetical protein
VLDTFVCGSWRRITSASFDLHGLEISFLVFNHDCLASGDGDVNSTSLFGYLCL